jgi:hypothetical protein
MSTGYQLHRMAFKPRPNLCYDTLEPDGKEIYDRLELAYGFKKPVERKITTIALYFNDPKFYDHDAKLMFWNKSLSKVRTLHLDYKTAIAWAKYIEFHPKFKSYGHRITRVCTIHMQWIIK